MLRSIFIPVLLAFWFLAFAAGASMAAGGADGQHLFDDSRPRHATVISTLTYQESTRYVVDYVGAHGAKVEAYVFVPAGMRRGAKAPCLVLIHGLGGSKESEEPLARAAASFGYSSVMIDQAGQGARATSPGYPDFDSESDLGGALRSDCITTVIDLRRSIDAAGVVPGVDNRHVGIVGYSMGALVGTILGGVDKRVQATALISGGGDIARILTEEAADGMAIGGHYAALIDFGGEDALRRMLADIDPLQYVGLIAPRALLMINGRTDDIIPPDRAQALYDAAGRGKQMIWYDGGHYPPWLHVYADLIPFFTQNLPTKAAPKG